MLDVSYSDLDFFSLGLSEKTTFQQESHVLNLQVADLSTWFASYCFGHEQLDISERVEVWPSVGEQGARAQLTDGNKSFQRLFEGLQPAVCNLKAVLEV